MARAEIDLGTSSVELLSIMSEGNPGAIHALIELVKDKKDPSSFMLVLGLDDMNMRGSQIHVGYKDYCGKDIDKFKEAIRTRDPEMVKKVNSVCSSHREVAVTGEASFKR